VALIFLTGLSGSGKTTIGELLAARLGMPFVDADQEIERVAGRTAAEIFNQGGELAFRDLETAFIRDVSRFAHVVIALGAGALERDDNFQRVSNSGTLVYLRADVPLLLNRLRNAPLRPLLASAAGPEELHTRLEDMRRRREQRYLSAEIVLDMKADRSLDDTVGVLVWELARRRGPLTSR
jgi:shikimate kinase